MKGLVIAALCTLLSVPVFAVTKTTYHFRERTVRASFVQYPAGNFCITNSMTVTVGTTVIRSSEGDTQGVVAVVENTIDDECRQKTLRSALVQVPVTPKQFQISGFNSAHLHLTTDLLDQVTGQLLPVTFDLVWTSSGRRFQNAFSQYRFNSADLHSTSIETGQIQPATITGSIMEEGVDLLKGVDSANVDAEIIKGNMHFVIMRR
jgi:hypothetical protein